MTSEEETRAGGVAPSLARGLGVVRRQVKTLSGAPGVYRMLNRRGEAGSTSPFGYKPTWAGLVETQPSPHDLHALITPPELLHMTHLRQCMVC